MHYMASMVQKTDTVNDDGSEKRSSIGERLKEERERLGFSQPAFAAIGGASKGSQLAWEKGTAMPNAEFLHDVARVGVDVLYVITGRRDSALTSPDEEMVLAGYRQLDARGRTGVLALIGGMQPPAEKKVKKTQAEMVFNGSVGDVKNIKGDYHETRHKTVPASSKKKRTDKGS
ncbi:helix-turn-helix domain-containing protein [Ralstonia pseudosolanacearum]|uniref:Dna-binding repressor transcription regulator protein n=1 Tax=Ralstonia nicotianae (strain ATCC BAA-1114 / GMI1000) TaxID=267608 RepID=Q8XY56_RALN1|nr:helix-turn-helix transcriptional regulator [Ralstonia pseudosolanacearum]AST27473.1 transcriptional regulator [Ralstonia pseudosolanacearum]MCQ4681208.1 helix-turn-helix domain-containing protein [Ralstonia pseudosolanacearum]MDC6285864.1 helix-turn-helix transcriptional regulator [Ralstonia pseudosolanacearum]CAD15609.1 putative dna-binding repressor transcription regulator protein [Ralstonia pseudosolanacearum GMI1000]